MQELCLLDFWITLLSMREERSRSNDRELAKDGCRLVQLEVASYRAPMWNFSPFLASRPQRAIWRRERVEPLIISSPPSSALPVCSSHFSTARPASPTLQYSPTTLCARQDGPLARCRPHSTNAQGGCTVRLAAAERRRALQKALGRGRCQYLVHLIELQGASQRTIKRADSSATVRRA